MVGSLLLINVYDFDINLLPLIVFIVFIASIISRHQIKKYPDLYIGRGLSKLWLFLSIFTFWFFILLSLNPGAFWHGRPFHPRRWFSRRKLEAEIMRGRQWK
jgi:hypothetical protein